MYSWPLKSRIRDMLNKSGEVFARLFQLLKQGFHISVLVVVFAHRGILIVARQHRSFLFPDAFSTPGPVLHLVNHMAQHFNSRPLTRRRSMSHGTIIL